MKYKKSDLFKRKNSMIEENKNIKLSPTSKLILNYINSKGRDDFPLYVADISRALDIHRFNIYPLLDHLSDLDLIDIVDLKSLKEIYKKGLISGDNSK